MGSLRLRVPVQGLAGIAALTLLQTSCGASVRSAAQSRKLERNPCGTVGIRNSLNRALRGVACSRTPLADWHAPLRPGRVRFRLGQNFQRTRRQRHPVLHTLRRNRPHPGLHVNLRPARPAHLPRTGRPSATGTQGTASPMPPPRIAESSRSPRPPPRGAVPRGRSRPASVRQTPDPPPPAAPTISPNPAAWCVRRRDRRGRRVAPGQHATVSRKDPPSTPAYRVADATAETRIICASCRGTTRRHRCHRI